MTTLLFPDNTVLINFAIVDRIDVLEKLLAGRGRWTLTIESECARSAREPGLERMRTIPPILGEALIPTQAERLDTLVIRERLSKPGDKPTDHLGEAETFAVINHRGGDGWFVTDDRGAIRFAASLPVRTLTTAEVYKLAVRVGQLEIEDAWIDLEFLRAKPRGLPRAPGTFHDFTAWCAR